MLGSAAATVVHVLSHWCEFKHWPRCKKVEPILLKAWSVVWKLCASTAWTGCLSLHVLTHHLSCQDSVYTVPASQSVAACMEAPYSKAMCSGKIAPELKSLGGEKKCRFGNPLSLCSLCFLYIVTIIMIRQTWISSLGHLGLCLYQKEHHLSCGSPEPIPFGHEPGCMIWREAHHQVHAAFKMTSRATQRISEASWDV